MKFPKTCKIHKAASKGAGRYPGMAHVLFTGKELVATDGNILAVVPTTDVVASETPGLIGTDAVTAALKVKGREATILARDKAEAPEVAGHPTFPRPEDEFPRWGAVLPALTDRSFRVGIDVSLLSKLAEALGDSKLVLSFEPGVPSACIRVDTSSSGDAPGAYGAIMPFCLDS